MSFSKFLDNNLRALAEEKLNTVEFWYRAKYNLPPTDPRFLNLEPWEMELEYEIDQIFEEKSKTRDALRLCPRCRSAMKGDVCTECGFRSSSKTEHYFDPDWEEYFNELEKDNEGLEDGLKGLKWEDVPDMDLGEVPNA